MSITLYELQPTRSARVRWTLLELGVPFESVEGRDVFAMPELAEIHPLSKLPALRDAGRPLFESAAICNWLADSHPEAGLIAPSGAWARALHDQWVAFTLSEIEAFLWHTARTSSSCRRKSAFRPSTHKTKLRPSAASQCSTPTCGTGNGWWRTAFH